MSPLWARWGFAFRDQPAWFFRLLFLAAAEAVGAEPPGQAAALARSPAALDAACRRAADRYHSALFTSPAGPGDEEAVRSFLTALADWVERRPAVPADLLLDAYEATLHDAPARKRHGAYYTPPAIVDAVLQEALPREPTADPPTVLDPACGAGAFLLRAFERLRPQFGERALAALHGVDLDPLAVEIARLGLLLAAAPGRGPDDDFPDLNDHIRCGNALLGADGPPEAPGEPVDWPTAFPTVRNRGGFDVVVGNPPWGQKGVAASPEWKAYLRQRFPSSAGIFDLFRPFVELSTQLTAPGGRVGLVLPDIVLLKNYPQTRRLLLDSLTLEHIGWWGQAFAGAAIDVATVVGRKATPPADHAVRVRVQDGAAVVERKILQADFLAQPRHAFNLHLTPARLAVLRRLAAFPRLGDAFEVHEGVHSGNMRRELFVDACVDDSCRELYVGRGEIRPYAMTWRGRYLRLGALAERNGRRYAHVGRAAWHEREKLLVRRTGDRLLAAVDSAGRYASNNFFLIFPRLPGPWQLSGLCAYLNSRLATWYFRAVEPRAGRAFAEVKIKHLAAFPLPLHDEAAVARLNALGAERATADEPTHPALDAAIDRAVEELLGTRWPVEEGDA